MLFMFYQFRRLYTEFIAMYLISFYTMKDFKAMESQSDEVMQIKQPQDECNHRIVELLSHPNCEKIAQICERRCKNNLVHDFAKVFHDRKAIDDFKTKFTNLEYTSTKQTQHYIRQLDEIQRNAIENIVKKKEECLRDIKQFKKDLMKQTYSDLENKFPNLYQKFKNQRFDTLNCNEVSWVMKMQVHHHTQKHTVINAKLVAILRKFETFKDVSKNLTHKLLVNKQKVKDIKIVQKNPAQQHVIRLKSNVNIQKPNYSQDKSKQEIQYLQKRKRELESSIKYLNDRNNQLSDQISNKIYKKRDKQNKMKIFSKMVNLHVQNIKVKVINPIENDIESNSESMSSQSPAPKDSQLSRLNIYLTNKFQASNQKIPPTIIPNAPSEKHDQKDKPGNDKQKSPIIANINSNIEDHGQVMIEEKKDGNTDKDLKNNEKYQNQVNQAQQNISRELVPQIQANITNNEVQKKNDLHNQPKSSVQQPYVKRQFIEESGCEKWNNKQLVDQIKKYGKTQSECLKVEYIDALRSFSTVKLPSAKIKINPYFKKLIRVEASPSKPFLYQDLAKQLVEQHIKSNKQKDDKKP